MDGEAATQPWKRGILTWIAAYAALSFVVFVAYHGTLDQFFAGAALLCGAVALYLRRGPWSWTLGPVLLFLSFLCRSDAAVSVAFLVPLWIRDAVLERRPEAARFAVLALAGTVAFLVLSFISQ